MTSLPSRFLLEHKGQTLPLSALLGCMLLFIVSCGGEIATEVGDADRDGIADLADKCPQQFGSLSLEGCPETPVNTVASTPLPTEQPPVAPTLADADIDGVADNMDACPNTMPNIKVDASGCALSLASAKSIAEVCANRIDRAAVSCAKTIAPVCANMDRSVRCINEPCDSTTQRTFTNVCDVCNGKGRDRITTVVAGECAPIIADDDGDGVINPQDLCGNTLNTERANSQGCAPSQIDSDMDGIADSADRCPKTMPATAVDMTGCGLNG